MWLVVHKMLHKNHDSVQVSRGLKNEFHISPAELFVNFIAVYVSKFLYYLRYNSMYVQLCLREQSQFHPSRITGKIGINDGRGNCLVVIKSILICNIYLK